MPPEGHHARATREVVDKRVEHVADLMRRLVWQRGKTNRQLAKEWGLSVDAVNDYASHASRIVRAEVVDPDAVQETVCVALSTVMRDALEDGDRKHAISAADTWSRIAGARAPERQNVEIRQPDRPAFDASKLSTAELKTLLELQSKGLKAGEPNVDDEEE